MTTPAPDSAITIGSTTTAPIELSLGIEGMTCTGCEEHVNSELSKVEGVASSKTSYEAGNSVVQFDPTKTKVDSIFAAIRQTGYMPTGLAKTQTK